MLENLKEKYFLSYTATSPNTGVEYTVEIWLEPSDDPQSPEVIKVFRLIVPSHNIDTIKREFPSFSQVSREIRDQMSQKADELFEQYILDYYKTPLTSDQIATLKKELARKQLQSVHINPEGEYGLEFSDCPPYCDDCMWLNYLHPNNPYFKYDDVKQTLQHDIVYSHRGKAYHYYFASQPTIEAIARHITDDEVIKYHAKSLYEKEVRDYKERKKEEECRRKEEEKQRKKQKFEEEYEKVKKFIEDHNMQEIPSIDISLPNDGQKIANAYYGNQQINAIYYPDLGILSVFQQYSFDWWGTTYYAEPDKYDQYIQQFIEEFIAYPSPYTLMKVIKFKRGLIKTDDLREEDKILIDKLTDEQLNQAIENFKERVFKEFDPSKYAHYEVLPLDSSEEELLKLIGAYDDYVKHCQSLYEQYKLEAQKRAEALQYIYDNSISLYFHTKKKFIKATLTYNCRGFNDLKNYLKSHGFKWNSQTKAWYKFNATRKTYNQVKSDLTTLMSEIHSDFIAENDIDPSKFIED